jgi:lysophospholipase L1-like esterase
MNPPHALWAGLLLLFSVVPARSAEPVATPLCPLRPGDRIVVHGDSVTALSLRVDGFVTRLHRILAEHYADLRLTLFADGVPGRTATGLIKAIGSVRALKPTVVVLYIGLNDVREKDVAAYRQNVTQLIGLYRDMGARVLLCTPTVRWGPSQVELDEQLGLYADAIRDLGKQHHLPVLDLRALFVARRAETPGPVSDGVHLSDTGNRWVADALLTAFGLEPREPTFAAVRLVVRGPGRLSDERQIVAVRPGDTLRLTAIPETGTDVLERWTITPAPGKGGTAVVTTDNPLSLTVTGDATVIAEFGRNTP